MLLLLKPGTESLDLFLSGPSRLGLLLGPLLGARGPRGPIETSTFPRQELARAIQETFNLPRKARRDMQEAFHGRRQAKSDHREAFHGCRRARSASIDDREAPPGAG